MRFNEVAKSILLPILSGYGFSISDERKGRILFSCGSFSVSAAYDYAYSKDFSLSVYFQLNPDEELCIEDHELVQLLGIVFQKNKSVSEEEAIDDFMRFYASLFKTYGAKLFTKNQILILWEKTKLRIIL